MTPVQMYVKGVRVALSNGALIGLCFGGTLALAVGAAAPPALLVLKDGVGPLWEKGWPFWAACALGYCLWLTLLLYGWFYLEAGLRGLVARAHRATGRSAEPGRGLRPAAVLRVFTFEGFASESARHRGRVGALISAYAGVGCLALLPLFLPLLAMKGEVDRGETGPRFALFLILFTGMALLASLLLLALSLHYQVAVTAAVQGGLTWREGVRRSTALIRARPLEFFAIFGLQLLCGMALGTIAFALQLPLLLLAGRPGMLVPLLIARGALQLLVMLPQAFLTVAAMGAYAAFCEPEGT